MPSTICPANRHFHVVYEQVGSIKRPQFTIEGYDPSMALIAARERLSFAWRGSLSVYDDQIGHEDEMPILHAYIEAK